MSAGRALGAGEPVDTSELEWWLGDAAVILQANGTETHAEKVREAREFLARARTPTPDSERAGGSEAVRVLEGANSYSFEKRLVIGPGDAVEKSDGGECIAFANEPWASRIASALTQPAGGWQQEQVEAREPRQFANMAWVLNHIALPDQWYAKFKRELDEDRAALAQPTGEQP